jgi:hypothetical protein
VTTNPDAAPSDEARRLTSVLELLPTIAGGGSAPLADKQHLLLVGNPSHPSLQFKKVGEFWSARVGLHHRALAVEREDAMVWVWIGSHDEYDRLLDKND